MNKLNKSQNQQLLHFFLFDPNIYISEVITLTGDIKAEYVKKAVEKAYTQNETTMSKVVLENGEAYFENLSETGCKVFIEQRDYQEIMIESERDTFKINEGELVRSYIIQKKDKLILFIMAHHIFGDANSLVLLAEDILNNLAGEKVEYKPLNNDGQITINEKVKFPFFSKLILKQLNLKWAKTGKIFTWDDYFNIHKEFWKDKQPNIRVEKLAADEVNRIKSDCKELGITVNSYIIAKLLSKEYEHKIIGIPVSLRGTNRSLSNQVTTIKIRFKYNQKLSFGENAKKLHKIIKKNLDNISKKYYISISLGLMDHTLLDGSLMATHLGYENEVAETTARLIGSIGDSKVDLGVTNLKNLNLKVDYDSFAIKDFTFIAATLSNTKNVVSVCTLNDEMSICYCDIKKLCQ